MQELSTTVVIPNYNGLEYLKACLCSLERQTRQDFLTLIIDNGSTDGSAEWLAGYEKGRDRIRTILLPENTGFSGAVNLGIRESRTPYVILLNNDVTAEPQYVEELVKMISRSERIFSVSAKMIQMYHPDLMDDAGDMYSVLGWAFQRGVGRKVHLYRRPAEVFSACAGAGIYRRKVFDEIGFFDEMHFAYLEDIDVGYRAKIHGYHNMYAPRARVLHVGSGTSGSKYNAFKVRLAARNNIYLNWKNMPWPQLLLNLPAILAGTAVKYGFFRKLGYGREYLEGVREGVRTAPKCRKVPWDMRHLANYLSIQAELVYGTFVYIREFLARHLTDRR
ncbi:MAG: glycosyltransferase family 2 protein [Clostridium sp.]|nr:glycosyltransferase family 2 protein [Clostridium sp.]